MRIIPVESVASTNLYLKELSHKQVLEEGTVIVTGNQTEGRGQRGNTWESEAGKNIVCSILLYPSFLPVQQNFLLSETISLGVKETLDVYTNDITIKWPNDIYHKEKKIAGILIENELTGNEYSSSIVGIGLNVNQEHFLSDAPNPVSLKQITGKDRDKESILMKLIQNILYRYEHLRAGNIEAIIRRYHDALYRKTGIHCYEDEDSKELFYARINRISNDGFLHLVTDRNEERSYAFKKVRFV